MSNQNTNRAMQGAVGDAVRRAVYGAVNRAVEEDSDHPALQDFLLEMRRT